MFVPRACGKATNQKNQGTKIMSPTRQLIVFSLFLLLRSSSGPGGRGIRPPCSLLCSMSLARVSRSSLLFFWLLNCFFTQWTHRNHTDTPLSLRHLHYLCTGSRASRLVASHQRRLHPLTSRTPRKPSKNTTPRHPCTRHAHQTTPSDHRLAWTGQPVSYHNLLSHCTN